MQHPRGMWAVASLTLPGMLMLLLGEYPGSGGGGEEGRGIDQYTAPIHPTTTYHSLIQSHTNEPTDAAVEIATACHDGVVRVFTRDGQKYAPAAVSEQSRVVGVLSSLSLLSFCVYICMYAYTSIDDTIICMANQTKPTKPNETTQPTTPTHQRKPNQATNKLKY